MKYIRAESFRKALRYQKRYLGIRLNALEELVESQQLSPTPPGPKNKFKVVVLSIIAMNRMKYLVRKYQRYLQKSSPNYNYKEKRANGGSSSAQHKHQTPSRDARDPLPTTTTSMVFGPDYKTNLSPGSDLYEIQPISKQYQSPRSPKDGNKTKPMLLQDLTSSPEEINSSRKPVRSPSHHHGTASPRTDTSERLGHHSRSISPIRYHHKGNPTTPFEELSPVKDSASQLGYQPSKPRDRRDNADDELLGDISRESVGITGRQYRSTSKRSFNSLAGVSLSPRRDNNNIIDDDGVDDYRRPISSSPPKSYPRPKSDVLRADFYPTRIDNNNYSATNREGRSSQDDLKDYMKKLEDLQMKLKTQQRESSSRRAKESRASSRSIAVDGDGLSGEF